MSNKMFDRFVANYKVDGVDHVRLSPHGETTLGKLASKDWRRKFFIAHIGEFSSPICFANWVSSGDEDARHNLKYRLKKPTQGYLLMVLYAKYHQLCSMSNLLERNKEMLDLPFVSYKVHKPAETGGVVLKPIREFDWWKEYPVEVKKMINHILDPNRGPKSPYPWSEVNPDILKTLNELLVKIAGVEGEATEEAEKEEPQVEPVSEQAATEEVQTDSSED